MSVAAGDGHMCVLLSDGNVGCSGSNDYGQLGIGSKSQKLSPSLVNAIAGASVLEPLCFGNGINNAFRHLDFAQCL